MKAAAANADKAVEDWKMAVLDREYLDKTQEDRVTRLVAEIAKLQKEGSLADSATDVNYHTARKIEKEVEKVIDGTDWNLVAALIYACKEADQWEEKQKETVKIKYKRRKTN